MSQENVEIARTWIEAWNRRDMEAMLAVTHPAFEFRTSGVFPDLDPVYSGHEGFRNFYRDFTAVWESFLISPHEFRDCGEQVLFLGTFVGRGRDGLEVRRQTAGVSTIRDALLLSIQNYSEWSRALEAVGNSE